MGYVTSIDDSCIALTISDASKVPPSRFQKREGSIYATPGSRDGHVGKNVQTAYHEKLKEKKWT